MSKRADKPKETYTVTIADVRFEGDRVVIWYTVDLGGVEYPNSFILTKEEYEKMKAEDIIKAISEHVAKYMLTAIKLKGTKIRVEV